MDNCNEKERLMHAGFSEDQVDAYLKFISDPVYMPVGGWQGKQPSIEQYISCGQEMCIPMDSLYMAVCNAKRIGFHLGLAR